MADKIRIGIVGATVSTSGSQWGARAHVPALKSLPEYELKAVCTAHDDTAKASAAAFGAELAYHDINDMVANPDIDLVVVSVKVPSHYGVVMPALKAGKAVYCEWPLGANLKEAEEMAHMAREKSVKTVVGLQGRSDATMMYARELIEQGYIGDVLAANMSITSQASYERASDRVWQGEWAAGANPLTIPGGHSIDAMCYILGEFREVSARVATMVKEWKLTDTGAMLKVDAPDNVAVAGALKTGAEAAVHISTVPSNPGGFRLDIWGKDGSMTVTTAGSANIGPSALFVSKGREAPANMPVPDRFRIVPEGTPAGQALNVAQAYTRFADAQQGTGSFDPDFDMAVTRHRLIDAIERSSAEGKAIKL